MKLEEKLETLGKICILCSTLVKVPYALQSSAEQNGINVFYSDNSELKTNIVI